MTLTTARAAIATALSTVSGLDVRARPIKTPKAGDGWVTITRIVPADFSACLATFTAVVVLGADSAKAEELFESYGVDVIDAVTSSTLNPTDVALEPQALVVGDQASPMYVLALTLSLLVESGTES